MNFVKNFKMVYKFSYGCRKYIILYFVMSLFVSLLGIIMPIVSAYELLSLTNGIFDKVIFYAFLIFGINILSSIINFFLDFSSQKFSKLVISKIQIAMGREILKIQLSDIDKRSNGLFIQRLTGDARNISSIFTLGVSMITSIIKDFGVVILAFIVDIWLGLFFILFLIIFIFLQRIKLKKIDKKDRDFRDQKEKTSGFITELIRGIRDIKMLNAEENFVKTVENNIEDLNEKDYQVFGVRRSFSLVSNFIKNLFEFLLVVIIILLIKKNRFDIAVGIIVFNYRYSITSLVYSLSYILDYIREFNLSCNRVFSFFYGKEFKKEKFGKIHLDKVMGNFSFCDVCFGYDDKLVLNNINFEVNANETVAFVGKSGVGKSTIFSLLCKMYDINFGRIMIDGVDINKLDKDSIRGNITVINQNPYIFNMSIRDNLKMVKDNLTDDEMYEACKLACIDVFISSLKDGYDTIVGEGGVKLSGGQKQRLAIARALIQKTEIILFDEATSALDNETQADIQKAILNMKNDYTILIIAHRLSTIVNCDRILYIEDGKVVDSGTHNELLKKNSGYKKMYESEIIIDK